MRDVLVELGFKVHRGFEIDRVVEPRPFVKGFDPIKDVQARTGVRSKGSTQAQKLPQQGAQT
jgi:hypothetical protein